MKLKLIFKCRVNFGQCRVKDGQLEDDYISGDLIN